MQAGLQGQLETRTTERVSSSQTPAQRGGSTEPRRLGALEGARGLACLGVVTEHTLGSLAPLATHLNNSPLTWAVYASGPIGTEWFFFLAGFVTYRAVMSGSRSWGAWMQSRLMRLYPPFLLIEILYLVISLLEPSASKIPAGTFWQTAGYLLANFSMLSHILGMGSLHSVTWTLGYNVLLYASLPLLVSAVRLPRQDPAIRFGFLFSLLVVAISLWSGTRHFRALPLFAGMISCELYSQYRNSAFNGRMHQILRALLPAAIIMHGYFLLHPDIGFGVLRLVTEIGMPPFICWCLLAPGTWWNRLGQLQPLQWLGKRSYACYLTHSLFLHTSGLTLTHLLRGAQMSTAAWWAAVAATIACSVVVGSCFYRLITSNWFESLTLWQIKSTKPEKDQNAPGFALSFPAIVRRFI